MHESEICKCILYEACCYSESCALVTSAGPKNSHKHNVCFVANTNVSPACICGVYLGLGMSTRIVCTLSHTVTLLQVIQAWPHKSSCLGQPPWSQPTVFCGMSESVTSDSSRRGLSQTLGPGSLALLVETSNHSVASGTSSRGSRSGLLRAISAPSSGDRIERFAGPVRHSERLPGEDKSCL